MFSVIFPGQGSQLIGMGKDFYDKYDIVKSLFKEADDVLGLALSKKSLPIPTTWEPWPGKITENIKKTFIFNFFAIDIVTL